MIFKQLSRKKFIRFFRGDSNGLIFMTYINLPALLLKKQKLKRKECTMRHLKFLVAFLIAAAILCTFVVTASASLNEYICARADLHNFPYGITQEGQEFTMFYHTEVLIRQVGTGNVIGQLNKNDTGTIRHPNDLFYDGKYWSSITAKGVEGLSASYILH